MKFTKLLLFCISFTLFSLGVSAQQVTVSGTITDDSGLPVPGATIMVKETKNAVSSDIDGNYQIQADRLSTLVYSFIGFTTKEEKVDGRTVINTKIYADTQSLEEVVVVGYGTQKKSVVTGAISGVKAKDLESLPLTRVEQSLQGRVSGVTIAMNSGQPGSSSHIRIRGTTTFNGRDGANNPLFVVDGLTVDNIDFLNQADIESIEVLKDAASQAIYGTRASTGVILITTKRGKSGKITVNYNGYTGLSSPDRKLDLLNATQYATLLNESYVAAGNAPQFANPAAEGVGTDWQDEIFNKSAKRESHEVSVSGGNESSVFYLSFALLDQEGIVSTDISNYRRKNIRLNSTHKVSKWLTVGQTAAYSNEKKVGIGNTNSEFGGPLASAINLDPTTPVIETDPTQLLTANYIQPNIVRDANGNAYGMSTLVTQEMANPLAFAQTRLGNFDWADNFVGNAYAEIAPIEGLKIRSTWGTKLAFYGGESFTPQFYLSAVYKNAVNSISVNKNRSFGWNVENTATYTKQLDKHNFSILIGQGTYVDNIVSGNTLTKQGIPTNNYTQASINFEVAPDAITGSAYENPQHRITSLFSRLNYDYNEKYLLSGVIRRDGSDKFGANHKYGNFPSFSLGWVASKEAFWPENKYVTQLKFRGGYGVTGNDNNLDFFQYESLVKGGSNYTIGTGPDGFVVIGSNPQAPPNPDLKWEETNQANIGMDMTLWQNLTLTVDFFRKRTEGILQTVKLPGFVGNQVDPYGNVATMENKGFEIELGYRKRFGDFNINLNGNFSYLNNEVTDLGPGIKFRDGTQSVQSSGPVTRTQVGHPYESFYGYQTQGIFQNQAEINAYTNSQGGLIQPNAVPGDFRWKDNNGDGQINADDKTFLGDPNPNFIYGFTVNVAYKGFDLLVFGQGVAGNQIYQGLRRLDVSNANWQTEALGRWTGEGTSNTYPRLTQEDTNENFSKPSDFYLEDGDFLRIKTIQLGYSLPSDAIGKAGLSRVRLYITGENVFTFTKYTGYDPEIGGTVLGIDRGYYPQAKSFMLGVNLQF